MYTVAPNLISTVNKHEINSRSKLRATDMSVTSRMCAQDDAVSNQATAATCRAHLYDVGASPTRRLDVFFMAPREAEQHKENR
jgi:hypothetical protein